MGENSGLGDVLCSCLGDWLVSTLLAQGILFICASKFISFSMPAPKPLFETTSILFAFIQTAKSLWIHIITF